MTVGERVMRRLVDRVELDDDSRDDLLHNAIRLGRERGRCGTAGEIAALASTGIELRARHATDGDTAAFLRQGLWFGGTLTAIAGVAALSPTAFAAEAGPAPIIALGALIAAVVGMVVNGRGLVAVVRVAACVAAVAAWWAVQVDQLGAPESALVTTSAIVLLVGARPSFDGGVRPRVVLALAVVAVAVGVLAAMTDIDASSVTVGFMTIVIPVGLLVVSPADPRLGVAAAVALFWRFVATDPAGLAAILVAVRAGESTLGPVIRWIVMGTGFLIAAGLTRRNLRLISAR